MTTPTSPVNWLSILSRLRVDRSRGIAPHKPLLLLIVLELIETGDLAANPLQLTPELAFRFAQYWSIVAHRRSQRPDIRLPFYHMTSDGLWQVFNKADQPATDLKSAASAVLVADFFELAKESEFRQQARAILIKSYFEPDEQLSLAALAKVNSSDFEQSLAVLKEASAPTYQVTRTVRFRLDIVSAYNYTCALTGYRVTTLSGGSIIDAAHIHQFAESQNNDPSNGLALSKNAHWLFDEGLWLLDDNYQVIIAHSAFDEVTPPQNQKPLRAYQGTRIALPKDQRLWPDRKHLAWHRQHRLMV